MTKVVYNACYGGFSLSLEAEKEYLRRKGFTEFTVDTRYGRGYVDKVEGWVNYYSRDIERDDPDLVAVVEDMGDKANGEYAKLRVAEIPEGTAYRIDEYDGFESIETKESYDWKVA